MWAEKNGADQIIDCSDEVNEEVNKNPNKFKTSDIIKALIKCMKQPKEGLEKLKKDIQKDKKKKENEGPKRRKRDWDRIV